jgi:tape measure domain-containing protein
MANIGTAYVRIAPNMTGIQSKIASGFHSSGQVAGTQLEKGLSTKSAAIAGAVAGVASAAISKAMNLIGNSIGDAVSRVDTLARFPIVMKNLGFSAEDASLQVNRIAKELIGLPTSLDSLVTFVQRVSPVSKSLEEATDLALAFNNAVLAGGGPTYRQADAIEQFSQMLAKGKPDMMAWRTLQEAMPATLGQIAKQLGITSGNTLELYDALMNGTIGFSDFTNAVISLNDKGLPGFKNFEDQAKDATAGIATGMKNAQTAITRGLAKIISSIGAGNVSKSIASIGSAFEKVFTVIANALSDSDVRIAVVVTGIGLLTMALWSAVPAIWALLSPLLPVIAVFGALVGIIKLVRANWDTIGPVVEKARNAFLLFWQTIQPIREFIANQFKAAWNDLKNSFESIKNSLAPFMPQLKILGVLLGVVILTPLIVLTAALVAAIAVFVAVVTVVARVIGWLSTLQAAFINVSASIQSAVNARIGAVINFFETMPGRIMRAVGNMGNLLYNSGSDIVNGLIRGIQDRANAAINTVSNLGNRISGAFKSALGIRSPSKVFANFGKNIDDGLAKGITRNTPVVTKAVTNLSDQTINSMATNANDVGMSANLSPVPDPFNTGSTGNVTNSSQNVNIQKVVLGDASAVQEFFKRLDQDTINVGMGMTPVQGAQPL